MKFNSRTLNQESSSIIHRQRFKESSSLPRFIKALKGYSAWVNKVILGELFFPLFIHLFNIALWTLFSHFMYFVFH